MISLLRSLHYLLSAPHHRLVVQFRPFRLVRAARYGDDARAPVWRRVVRYP